MADSSPSPILIIGAGISGLTLAQACRKRNIAFRIFERDASATHRSAGWGLTLNWSLPAFRELLPNDVVERLPDTYVNKAAVDSGEKGSFTFFDLSTGEAKWNVPASERIRVSRERLRGLMLLGLDIEYSKRLTNVESDARGVTATFDDGSKVEGSLLIGCDGANSQVRRLCHPQYYQTEQLPIRFIGAAPLYDEDQIRAMHALDPYFLQGSCPTSDVFLWFSFLTTPGDVTKSPQHHQTGTDRAKSAAGSKYLCQVMTSWPYRSGFLGHAEPVEMPTTKAEKLAWMKTLTEDWVEPFKSIVCNIPEDSEVLPIYLADWLPRRTTAFNSGRVILLGDAAHTMVMYRGEGANQSIMDVKVLLGLFEPLLQHEDSEVQDFRAARDTYEDEMVERTELAVLASRQACLDAHEWQKLDDQSPLVRRRLMRADLEARKI
jgi:2-polyprenyl-6-methoxyphenol hydroxylase-like FAD-dependent oxidoreductase